MNYQLMQGDCADLLPTIPDASIDLIATDPPYMGVKDDAWDNQWRTRNDYLSWLGNIANEWQRILKPNGSLYVFASPQMAWHVEGVVQERFNVLNSIIWHKPGQSYAEVYGTENFRTLVYMSERIIFAEQGNADAIADQVAGFTEAETALKRRIFGDYLMAEFGRAKVTSKKIAALFPSATGGLTGCVSNWLLGLNVPTKEQYHTIRNYLNSLNCAEYLRQEYEELRQEYEELRRPFNATPDAPYTDVWTFPTVMNYTGKHVCEKPLPLMEHIVKLSSKPGATVLDCFMGSGTTGHACATVGDRKFIGIEQSREWFDKAERRIIDGYRISQKLPKQLRGKASDLADMPLFAAIGD